MSEVSGWVFTICSGALICGIVSALIPSKSYEGAIQLLLGLFMLFCFLVPVSLDWQLPEVDLEAVEEKRLQAASEAEEKLSEQVELDSITKLHGTAATALQQYDIAASEIDISIDADKEGRTYAIARLPERCRGQHTTLQRLLQYEFGIAVQMEYSTAP